MSHLGSCYQQPAKETSGSHQEPHGYVACILRGAQAPLSNCHLKKFSREVSAVLFRIEATQPLRWSEWKISFHGSDHPKSAGIVGTIPLVCTHTINNIAITKMLLDGGAGLNVISVETLEKLQTPYERLVTTQN